MKRYLFMFLLCTFSIGLGAQSLYSFESSVVPSEFTVLDGNLTVVGDKYKLGNKSLLWNWGSGSKMTMDNPVGLDLASASKDGGITFWIYSKAETTEELTFHFYAEAQEKYTYSVKLNFTGWRNIWARFGEDMAGSSGAVALTKVVIDAPKSGSGDLYIDYLEFSEKVSWEKMSSDQHTVKESKGNVDDFIGLRDAIPTTFTVAPTSKEAADLALIEQRLEDWYISTGAHTNHRAMKWRKNNTNGYVTRMNKNIATMMANVSLGGDGKPLGTGLYPMYANTTIDGSSVIRFRELNENYLTQLALDHHLNNKTASKDNALTIFDWMHDQGWANGSTLGSIRFEKLRSAGYFNSVFLLRNELGQARLERELKTLGWFSLMGSAHTPLGELGENTDNIRTLAIAKVAYALMLQDDKAKLGNMKALVKYFETVSRESHGYLGLFKPDNSGFHHRSAYYSAYFPEATYTLSLVYYLFHGTEFALSDEVYNKLKDVLLTYRFVAGEYNIPGSVSGRFPGNNNLAITMLPSFAYLAASKTTPDQELVGVLKRLWNLDNALIQKHAQSVSTGITHTATIGEIRAMAESITGANASVTAEARPVGGLYQPFAGLMTVRDNDFHYSIAGWSKYVWDYESGSNENMHGRYLRNGHIQMTNLNTGVSGFTPANAAWDWSRLPGATAKKLSKTALSSDKHRNFSDQAFLGGVVLEETTGLFSVQLHDTQFEKSFYANKSVFTIGNTLLNIGSKITSAKGTIETTLFQNEYTPGADVQINGQPATTGQTGIVKPTLIDNYGYTYKVIDGDVDFYQSATMSTAVINHGATPTDSKYAYAVLPTGDDTDLAQIEILKQDDKAHYIHHKTKHIHAAALFTAGSQDGIGRVRSVNAPALFVMKETALTAETTQLDIVLSDPDMRMKTAATMDKLTNADIAYPGDAFAFEMVIDGAFKVDGSGSKITATVSSDKQTTTLNVNVKEGASYKVTLVTDDSEPVIESIILSETLKTGLSFMVDDINFSIIDPMLFTITPSSIPLSDITFTVTDATVANVVDGIIKVGQVGVSKVVISSISEPTVKSEEFSITVNPKANSVTSITLSETLKAGLSFSVGEADFSIVEPMLFSLSPSNLLISDIKYEVTNATVADVIGGVIKIGQVGVSKVTISSISNPTVKSEEFTITVTPKTITSITLSETLKAGLEFTVGDADFSIIDPMLFSITPADIPLSDLTYTANHPEIADIVDGVIKIIKAGTSKIVISSKSKPSVKSEEFVVTVNKKPSVINSISLSETLKSGLEFTEGDADFSIVNPMLFTIKPVDIPLSDMKYTVTDATVADVVDGIIKIGKAGVSKVVISSISKPEVKTGEFKIIVKKKPIIEYSITLSETLKTGLSFLVGDADFSIINPMLFTIVPADTPLSDVKYAVSDAAVADIIGGVIKIGKSGVSKVVISSISNPTVRSEEFMITVTKKPVIEYSITLSETLKAGLSFIEGDTDFSIVNPMLFTIIPANTSLSDMKYTVSDASVANVVGGVIKIGKAGVSKVVISSISNPDVKSEEFAITVNVKDGPTPEGITKITLGTELTAGLIFTIGDADFSIINPMLFNIEPADTPLLDIIYTSDNNKVAQITDGVIKLGVLGTAKITISSISNPDIKSKAFTVKVEPDWTTIDDPILKFNALGNNAYQLNVKTNHTFRYEVYNINGTRVTQRQGLKNSADVSINSYPKGLYILRVYVNNYSVKTYKLKR